jgi:uncharacterized protein (DUF3820 family)
MVGFVEDGVEMATEMPFGKHKGRPLHDLPGEYLHWLAGRELSGWLADAVAAELTRRRLGPDGLRHSMVEIVQTGFRELAKRVHPDHGGDTASMREILAARAELLRLADRSS